MIMLIMIMMIIGEIRKGIDVVSTNGVTATFMCFARGTFWVLPLTYCYIPFFPNPSKYLRLQRPQ